MARLQSRSLSCWALSLLNRSALVATIVAVVLGGIFWRFDRSDPDSIKVRAVSASATGIAASSQDGFGGIKTRAEKGDAKAQNELGEIYSKGKGVPHDYAEAIKWFRKSAEQGDPIGQLKLGSCYAFGQGVVENEVEAVKWWRKAAEQGNADAEMALGQTYDNSDEALKWYVKAAERGDPKHQSKLASDYYYGFAGVPKNLSEAVKWYRKAAELGYAEAQAMLGWCYSRGYGVTQDDTEAVNWNRKAANQGNADGQLHMGLFCEAGKGVSKDYAEAAKWYRKAAEQGNESGQTSLGVLYEQGQGMPKDYVQAYKWYNLSVAQDNPFAKEYLVSLVNQMTRSQIADGQRLAREFKPRKISEAADSGSIADSNPAASGTGFFISPNGYLISNNHVVDGANQVRLVTSAGLISAKVVKVDAANDLALLKAEGKFSALPVAASRGVKMGGTVVTVGFPNIGLQGFAPKLAKGEIASLSGAVDDARYFQISVPVQPGNSGGALVDERGNVVGVVSAKLNASAALAMSGTLPENVNYAVKSSYLLSFLESVPEVAAKLKEPSGKEKKFEDVVKEAEQAAVLVLVY